MVDPFTSWSRMIAAGMDLQKTWLRAGETLYAAASVIEARGETMREAACAPSAGGMAELSRIVPEKVDAFGRSGAAVMTGLIAMQAAYWEQARRVSAMMMSGRMPSVPEAAAFARQTNDYALGSIDAGARMARRALAPVHKTATGNARRLSRRRSA